MIKLVKRVNKIYDFKNDFMFKHSLGNNQDSDSFYLLKLFIEGILNISRKSITILNLDLVVENIEDKDMLLDIEYKPILVIMLISKCFLKISIKYMVHHCYQDRKKKEMIIKKYQSCISDNLYR